MTRSLHRLAATLACIVSALASGAHAQDSANAILEASKQAIAEIPGFNAQFRMQGDGGSMFSDSLPSMNGKLFFGTHDEHGRVIHAVGEAKEQQTAPSRPMEILLANDRLLWVDHEQRIIHETPNRAGIRGNPTALTLVLIDSLISDDPYARDANNAQSIELGEQETIAGVLCDKVVIKRAEQQGGNTRGGAGAYTDAVWYIGAEDKLPRKVEHITDAGMIKMTLSFEMSNLTVAEPEDDDLWIERDGFDFRSRLPQPRQESEEPAPEPEQTDTPADETPAAEPPARPRQPAASGNPRAPSYAFIPVDGSEVNNATQAGRVTVMYFWGSWCVPCEQSSPLVSEMAADLAGEDVDVFGLAIRERDRARVANSFETMGFSHTLVTDADDLAPAFKVRVFPTIVVIDADGEIVFQRAISRETDAAELVEAARQAVNGALGGQ